MDLFTDNFWRERKREIVPIRGKSNISALSFLDFKRKYENLVLYRPKQTVLSYFKQFVFLMLFPFLLNLYTIYPLKSNPKNKTYIKGADIYLGYSGKLNCFS